MLHPKYTVDLDKSIYVFTLHLTCLPRVHSGYFRSLELPSLRSQNEIQLHMKHIKYSGCQNRHVIMRNNFKYLSECKETAQIDQAAESVMLKFLTVIEITVCVCLYTSKCCSKCYVSLFNRIGLSRERVRQVGLVALEKLKHAARKRRLDAMLIKQ